MRYTVGQLSKIFNISSQAIHGYVDMGILPCERDNNGYRYFDDYSFQILGTIIKNRNIGFPLKDSDYVYQKSNLYDILDRMNAQESKLEHELDELICQKNQLHNDIKHIQQALIQHSKPTLGHMDGLYRYNLGETPTHIVELSKKDPAVSLWYSNLFYTQSSLLLDYQEDHIRSIQYCLITSKENYHHYCEQNSAHVEYIKPSDVISCMSTYKNKIDLNLLESLITKAMETFSSYSMIDRPFTRLITSFSDENCEKVNVFELIIPVKEI